MKPNDKSDFSKARVVELVNYLIAECDEPVHVRAAWKLREELIGLGVIQPLPKSEDERLRRTSIEWMEKYDDPHAAMRKQAKYILSKIGMPPPKRMVQKVGWVCVHENGFSPIYKSEQAARDNATFGTLAIGRVEWEEPE